MTRRTAGLGMRIDGKVGIDRLSLVGKKGKADCKPLGLDLLRWILRKNEYVTLLRSLFCKMGISDAGAMNK